MADTIDIDIGGQVFTVPAWATEETAKSMMKYNEASAKALTELLRTSTRGNQVVMKNQALFREMKNATVKAAENFSDTAGSAGRDLKEGSKEIKAAGKDLGKRGKEFFTAFDKADITGMVSAIAAVGGLGGVAGYGVKVLQNYTQNLMTLANTGIGLNQSFSELRQQAAGAGMDMENYTKLMSTNGDNLRALGDTTGDGAMRFTELSRQVRTAAREFNNFGLTNTELNEAIMQEIELRRTSGRTQAELANDVAGSMNRLMVESTQLANLTGQDRREVLRQRQQAMQSGAATAFRMRLSGEGGPGFDNYANIASLLGAGGPVGEQLGQAFVDAIGGGIDLAAVNGGQFARLSAFGEGGQQIRDLFEFIRANFRTMDTEEFNLQVSTMLGDMQDALSAAELDTLGTFAAVGDETASQIVQFYANLQGLSDSVEENRAAMDATAQAMRDNEALAIPAAVEEMVNSIKGAVVEGINEAFQGLASTQGEAGQMFLDGVRNVTDSFQGNTVWEGAWNSIGLLGDNAQESAIGLGALAAVFVGGMFLRNIRALATLGGLTSAGAVTSATSGGGIGAFLRGALKKAGPLGVAVSAGSGMLDSDYRADETWGTGLGGALNRGGLGLMESVIDVGDLAANIATGVFGDGFDNDIDMSQAFKESMTRDGWARDAMQLRVGSLWDRVFGPGEPLDPGFQPGVSGSSPGYTVPEGPARGVVPGAVFSSSGEMMPGSIDPSVAWRFPAERLEALIAAQEEANRLARRQLDALDGMQ